MSRLGTGGTYGIYGVGAMTISPQTTDPLRTHPLTPSTHSTPTIRSLDESTEPHRHEDCYKELRNYELG